MIVEDVRMLKNESDRAAMLQLLETEPEAWASMRGMMAMLTLPLTVEGRQRLEVEIAPEVWRAVDQVSYTPPSKEIVVAKGVNGHREEWRFNAVMGAPRWRVTRTSDGGLA